MTTLTLKCQFKSSTCDKVLVLRHSGCPWERHALRVAHTEPELLSPLLELWCTPSLTPLPSLKGLLCHSTSYISMPAPQPSSALAVGFVQLRTRRRGPAICTRQGFAKSTSPTTANQCHKMALSQFRRQTQRGHLSPQASHG